MIAEEIRQLRDRLQLTQSELAFKLGVTLRAVQYWEGGDRQPGGAALKLLVALATEHQRKAK